jgi:NAD(P)-dependent dehydrogenase (short-subunit alcohol dehydrogenase family)
MSTRTIQVEEVDVRGSRPTPLAGSTVVITGAGSGMGRALAQRLSAYGCAVAAVDIGADALAQTESLLSGPSLMRRLDVRDRHGLLGLAAEVAEWAPAPIGAVFNNAGVGMSASVAGTPIEDHEWLMSINLDGVISATRAFLPVLMRQGSGAIVNTSSVFGLAGIPFQSSYCAAKFAVRGFTDSLRQELRGTGVRAINVHPGGIKTGIARSAKIHEDPRGQNRSSEEIAAEFDALVQTTPQRAAELIHRGVDAGKARILVGPDAHLFDIVARVTPTHYYRVLEPLELLASRATARKRARAAGSGPAGTIASGAGDR